MQENLFVCVPPEHELAHYESLTFEEINGFNFLLRSEPVRRFFNPGKYSSDRCRGTCHILYYKKLLTCTPAAFMLYSIVFFLIRVFRHTQGIHCLLHNSRSF